MSRILGLTVINRRAAALTAALLIGCSLAAPRADAATITVAYADGMSDVVINGYGTAAMGTFRLETGAGQSEIALCVEADAPHSTASDIYGPVDRRIDSAWLDALVWTIGRGPVVDADTAVAASALAWFYAQARRNNGALVWADGSRAFAPIGPVSPEPWDTLPRLSLSHPVGLRASGIDIDGTERRVASLHREVAALRGPWQLMADPATHSVQLSGPGGGIPHQVVRIEVMPTGGEPIRSTVTTDASGGAVLVLPALPDGGTVTMAADGPGPHREWDGGGRVQRMVTATTLTARASFEVPPLPRHIVVTKRSTDPTIGVDGAVFGLFDAHDVEVERVVSALDGNGRFTPIDPSTHPAPYTIRELSAPPGLARSTDVVTVRSAGTDPTAPTVIEIMNEPIRVPVRIRKVLSIDEAGPPDRSGFEFTIRRRADGSIWHTATAVDEATPPVLLPLGDYEVCEVAVPSWAVGLIDGGCVVQVVDLSVLALSVLDVDTELIVDYRNLVPEPIVDTHARDRSDGDQVIATGEGRLVDVVHLTRLIPGTAYTVTGSVILIPEVPDAPERLEDVGSTTFVADAPEHTVEVELVVAPTRPGSLVVTERVSIGDTSLVEHADLDDVDQTITVVAPPATTTTSVPPLTTAATTTTTTAAATTTTTSATSATSTTVDAPFPTLPRTGGHPAAALLRWGDIGFVVGVALIAIVGLLPARRTKRGGEVSTGTGRATAGR